MSPELKPIREWHVVIPGFTQRFGDLNGMIELWRQLHAQLSGPDRVVFLDTWNANWRDRAEHLWRLRPHDGRVRICIYGYSWGGASAAALCHHLHQRGLFVDTVVLSDAVYRHAYALGSWRALVPWSVIRFPDNVQRVIHYVQRQPLLLGDWPYINPRGHRIEACDPRETQIFGPFELERTHAYMDDAETFRAKCLEVALGPQKGEPSP